MASRGSAISQIKVSRLGGSSRTGCVKHKICATLLQQAEVRSRSFQHYFVFGLCVLGRRKVRKGQSLDKREAEALKQKDLSGVRTGLPEPRDFGQ